MVLQANETYRLNYQVDLDCNTGSKFVMSPQIPKDPITGVNKPYFEFTGSELEEAIIIMGMLPDEAYDPACQAKRAEELIFKNALISAVLCEKIDRNGNMVLAIDDDKLSYFDSSEKAAVSYWLGMFFATLIAKKEYGYSYIIHYARFMNSKYMKSKPIKTSYLAPNTKKKIKLSTPDLIAMTDMNPRNSKYGVFEAKGYQVFSTKTMKKATEQVQQIKSINNTVPEKIVAYTRLSPSGNTIRTKDPEGGIFDIEIDNEVAILWQYLPIVELFGENGYEREKGFCVLNRSFMEGSSRLKVSEDLFDVLHEYHRNLDNVGADDWSRNKIANVIKSNQLKVIVE